MKAPDKLYLSWIIWGSFINTIRDPDNDTQVEYIRKDALLGRLEKVAAEYKKRSDEGELVWQNMCGINKAIDILNEI